MTRTQPRLWMCAFAAVLAFAATGAAAQKRYGSSMRDSTQTQQHEAATAQEPFALLERELPSLNVDLLLTAGQVELWRAFERDVRDMADMGRAQHRYLQSLRDGGESTPTAATLIAALAEDERTKNEAMLDLRHHLDALYAALDNTQKRTLDRRVVRSQTEPPAH
jgi:LTXXQ motif family protein